VPSMRLACHAWNRRGEHGGSGCADDRNNMNIFTVKELRQLTADQIVTLFSMTKPGSEFCRLLVSMQTDPGIGGDSQIAIAERRGRIVSWARSEQWQHGIEYSTLEACTGIGYRRLGYATTCVRMLLAVNATSLDDYVAVFSDEMRSLAAKVGFSNVTLFRRTDPGWEVVE